MTNFDQRHRESNGRAIKSYGMNRGISRLQRDEMNTHTATKKFDEVDVALELLRELSFSVVGSLFLDVAFRFLGRNSKACCDD